MPRPSTEEMLEKLRGFSTPTLSNTVATYPGNPYCLGLYDPWEGRWYTDQSVRCVFPEMGRRIGFAVTVTMAMPDPKCAPLSFTDLAEALYKTKKPSIVVCQQVFPPEILDRVGLFGGQIT
jgi:4-hydroxy-4-methyl-2-oxoglutarate aldolase